MRSTKEGERYLEQNVQGHQLIGAALDTGIDGHEGDIDLVGLGRHICWWVKEALRGLEHGGKWVETET